MRGFIICPFSKHYEFKGRKEDEMDVSYGYLCMYKRRNMGGSEKHLLLWIWIMCTTYPYNPSGHTMALGSTQPLTETSTRNVSWGVKAASA